MIGSEAAESSFQPVARISAICMLAHRVGRNAGHGVLDFGSAESVAAGDLALGPNFGFREVVAFVEFPM